MNELVIGDQKYISSKRAAEITGYAKDYIGQLCREGRVEARLVGRSWYVREAAIKDHRFGLEKSPLPIEKTEPVIEAATQEEESPKYVPDVLPTQFEEEAPKDLANEMQEAWQEWFSHNKEEEPQEIQIHKMPEEETLPEVEENQPQEALIEPERPVLQSYREEDVRRVPAAPVVVRRNYVAMRTFLLAIAALSIGTVVIGTGLMPLKGIGSAAVIDFISGTKIYSN